MVLVCLRMIVFLEVEEVAVRQRMIVFSEVEEVAVGPLSLHLNHAHLPREDDLASVTEVESMAEEAD